MKINPKYGEKIIAIPAGGVLENLKDATREELSVLLFTLANQSCTMDEAMKATGLTRETVEEALSAWKKLGVLTYSGVKSKKATADKNNASAEAPKETELKKSTAKNDPLKGRLAVFSSELPSYTTAQINEVLEKNKETKALIDACQQTLGKILKIHEIETLMKLYDYLGLEADYILLLCAHCASLGKTSLRYIEKTAVGLFDDGITKYNELETYFEYFDTARSMEGKLRRLFGMGERAFTKKEKSTFIKWVSWGYTYEIVEKAYETMVDSINKVSTLYIDRILENWHNAGYKTIEEIDLGLEEYKKKKKASEKGSFDTDDFFEAALKRSYAGNDIKI